MESDAARAARLRDHITSCRRTIAALERVHDELERRRRTAHVSMWAEVDANLRNNQRTIDTVRRGMELAKRTLEKSGVPAS